VSLWLQKRHSVSYQQRASTASLALTIRHTHNSPQFAEAATSWSWSTFQNDVTGFLRRKTRESLWNLVRILCGYMRYQYHKRYQYHRRRTKQHKMRIFKLAIDNRKLLKFCSKIRPTGTCMHIFIHAQLFLSADVTKRYNSYRLRDFCRRYV